MKDATTKFHVLLTDYVDLHFDNIEYFIDWYSKLDKKDTIKKMVMTVKKKDLTLKFDLL